VTVLSAVGRPYAAVGPELRPDARLLVLTGDPDGARRVAGLVAAHGLTAELTVLERLGGPRERITVHPAERGDPSPPAHDRLAIVAVRCAPAGAWMAASRVPGLPDEAFATDGVLTKQEVRAVTLAALAPVGGELLWDVGAGSGGITTEWLRADRRCRAVAIETRADRAAHLRANAERLAGAVEPAAGQIAAAAVLRVVQGRAPGALAGLPTPDAVFVGGGATTPGVIETCLAALRPGGRLVVNAVTLETEAVLVDWHRRSGGRLRRIAISHAEPVGSFTAFRPALPVTQWIHTA